MVYRLNAGTVIDQDGNLQIENLYATGLNPNSNAFAGIGGNASVARVAGGRESVPAGVVSTIDGFPLIASTNASDVGDLTVATYYNGGASSTTHGYSVGGGYNPPFYDRDVISKFPFSAIGDATDVGDLPNARHGGAGAHSPSHGYNLNLAQYPGSPPTINTNEIVKFAFASDGNASDVGDTTEARRYSTGTSSETHAYAAGGYNASPTTSNIIDNTPFASDTNSSDVGDLTQARWQGGSTGASSLTHGYKIAGSSNSGPTKVDTIDKFPFSSNANATDVGELTMGTSYGTTGISSETHGYAAGRGYPPITNNIDRFPFSADGSSVDVGDLTEARYALSGTQG